MKTLRWVRILLAAGVFAGLTLAFADPVGVCREWTAPLARLQFLPACLAGAFGIVLAIAGITLLCGRVYCSVICPLGILQDIAIFLRRLAVRRGFPVSPGRALVWVRALAAVAFLAGGFLGAHFAWLEPYGIYGRLASVTAGPLGRCANNRLAAWAETHASYVAVRVENILPPTAFVVFAVSLALLVLVLAVWKGRFWCNTICPAGTVLGLLARWAWLRPRLNAAKCVRCGACARRCKARCIDLAAGTVDASRCVACLDCAAVCPREAIEWK